MTVMKYINGGRYCTRQPGGSATHGRGKLCKKIYRDWWLVKASKSGSGRVQLGTITFPQEFLGKRVRFKIEILE
jgi:hypothetical protein